MDKIESRTKTLISLKNLWVLFTIIVVAGCGGTVQEIPENFEIPSVTYSGSVFVDSTTVFNNESLFYPAQVRITPNNEVITMDMGNSCLYVFSPEGDFLRRIGYTSEGSGELRYPRKFDIDSKGLIYVYDNATKRITIFSSNGAYHGIIPVRLSHDSRFSISPDGDVIINQPETGYYISVYDDQGRLKRKLGRIKQYNELYPYINTTFAQGIPYEDDTGKFYIFLRHIPIIVVLNEFGVEIDKKIIHSLPGKYIYPGDLNPKNMEIWVFLQEVLHINNRFYVLFRNDDMYVIEKDLTVSKKIQFSPTTNFINEEFFSWNFKAFGMSQDEQFIYFPLGKNRQLYKFEIQNFYIDK